MQKKAEFICNSLVALEHILSQKRYAMSPMGFDPGHLTLYATALPSEPKGSPLTRVSRGGYKLVRDSFVRLAGAVGCQSALHKENSGFAAPTLGRHISTFRGYQILFSIRNPYINRFTNHFSIHS